MVNLCMCGKTGADVRYVMESLECAVENYAVWLEQNIVVVEYK